MMIWEKEESGREIIVSTTRPKTVYGDREIGAQKDDGIEGEVDN